MDDGFIQVMIELVQPITALLCGLTLVGIRTVIIKLRDFDKRLEERRKEMSETLKEYQRIELCNAHREYLNKRIDTLYGDRCTYEHHEPKQVEHCEK